jgi:hypothetical protein
VSTYEVRGGGASATIDPARGGKILSLCGPDGREWLSQAADPSRAPDRGAAVFTASDPAGWDECAPSIDACEIGGRTVPDHGDLWTAEWTTVSAGPDSLELSVLGRSLDYRLDRRIIATDRGVRLDYVATAAGIATPFLWAAHPQFVSPPGSMIELPTGVTHVIDVIDPTQPVVSWCADLATVDSLPDGGCRKVYVDPATHADAAILRHPDGATLTMSWHNCDYLGLWFDNRAYSREPVVAIEPSLGFRDSLSWAVEHGHVPILAPGSPLRWSLEIAISNPI